MTSDEQKTGYVTCLVESYIPDASDDEKAALVQELKDFAAGLYRVAIAD